MKPLYLFNTLTQKKEEFKPINPPHVGMYSCGPTVYDHPHIGNYRAYLFVDLLRRVLKYNGFDLLHVMNITDVGHLVSDADEGEDKLEKGAQREGLSVWEIAQKYTDEFFNSFKQLNIQTPDKVVKATDHIQDQIELVQQLEAKGFTYVIADGVYFDTAKWPEYGKLARLNLEGQREGARVEATEGKKNATDFALWKFSPKTEKREMEWDSPWGVGFPGWHIECSAMSMKYLGETFDIHTGGVDHIPIHHTNEIAQSEAATGKLFVHYWVHNEFILIDGKKMSKSLGNSYTLDDFKAKGFSPLAFRYLALTSSYRDKLNFTWESLGGAQNALENLYGSVAMLEDAGTINAQYAEVFAEALNDDLASPSALALVWKLLKDEAVPAGDKLATVLHFDLVLGLNLAEERLSRNKPIEVPDTVKHLLEDRKAAREAKDWALSDSLRGRIADEGFAVKDTPEGQKVSKK